MISKRLTVTILLLCLLASLSFSHAAQMPTPISDGGPEIASKSAVLMDVNTGALLYAKNADETGQPSSLTKLLTAYIAFSELEAGSSLSISAEAAKQNFPTAANVGYKSGEIVTVSDALKGMLIASAEDCCYGLTEKAGNSMEGFAAKMNRYAGDLGFVNSHFVNSMGRFAEGHYSCAYDMGLVAAKLMKEFPSYKAIVSAEKLSLGATNMSNSYEIKSSHRFMNGKDSYDSVYAGKTGGSAYEGDGSWALCTYMMSGKMNLVCIVMGAPDNDSTYKDTKLLFDYAKENFETLSISSALNVKSDGLSSVFEECPLFSLSDESLIYLDSSAFLILPKKYDASLITSKVSYNEKKSFSYGENRIGTLSLYYNGLLAGEAGIMYYAKDVSMSALAFNSVFPAYLKIPGKNNGPAPEKGEAGKPVSGFLDKLHKKLGAKFTKARLFSILTALICFIAGTVVICLLFPKKSKIKIDHLYFKRPDDDEDDDVDSSVSEVKRSRNTAFNDMHEISSENEGMQTHE